MDGEILDDHAPGHDAHGGVRPLDAEAHLAPAVVAARPDDAHRVIEPQLPGLLELPRPDVHRRLVVAPGERRDLLDGGAESREGARLRASVGRIRAIDVDVEVQIALVLAGGVDRRRLPVEGSPDAAPRVTLAVLSDVGVLGELLELRRAIAIEALGLAAERGTDEEIANLRAHVEAQREVVDRPRELMEMDLAFARLVVRATHNIAFELVYNTVSRAIGQSALELAYQANATQTLLVYDRLIDLMERREAGRVRQVTQRLLTRLDRQLIEAFGG